MTFRVHSLPCSSTDAGTASESIRAATMAITKFLYDRHKTNGDTSENLINNAEDVENTAFQVM